MGKFGIGARVRDDDGDEGEIIAKRRGERHVRYGSLGFDMWRFKGDLTPVDEAPAATDSCADTCEVAYKVGDRVVCVDYQPDGLVGSVTKVFGDHSCVAFDDWNEGHAGEAEDGSKNHWYVDHDNLRPFRLEAGRYYKTRGGRKVGPMEAGAGDCLSSTSVGQVAAFHHAEEGSYTSDGTWLTSGGASRHDIVAEWVEPEADLKPWKVDAAPETPTAKWTIEDAKPGDVVRCDAWTGEMYRAGQTYTVDANGKIEDSFGDTHQVFCGEWSLLHTERAEPTPIRKFKVGDRVNYIGGKSQNIWQGVTITRDSGIFYFATCPKQGEGAFTDDMIEPAAPAPKFKVGDRVVFRNYMGSRDCYGTVIKVDGGLVYSDDWSVGLSDGCLLEEDLELVTTPAAPAFPIGAKVTLTATVTGHNPVDKHNVNIVVDGLPACCASHGIPAIALRAA